MQNMTSDTLQISTNNEPNRAIVHQELGYKLTVTLSNRKTVLRVNLNLEGEVCLKNVAHLGLHFRELLQKFDYLNLQLTEISALDLAALQLFWHLKNLARKQGKTVAINAKLSAEMQQLIQITGFSRIISSK